MQFHGNRVFALLMAPMFIAFSAGAAQGVAQVTAESDQAPLHIEVKALLIPVVVRDAHDQVVADLGQADFEVFDQGKRQAITGFSVIRSAPAAVNGPATAAAPGLPASAPPSQ